MKKPILTLCVIIFGIAAVFSACSGDKKTNPAMTPGDPNDPNFTQAQVFAEQFVGTLTDQVIGGFEYIDWNGPGPMKVVSDSSSFFYDSTSGWWVIYLHHDDSTSYDLTYTDSVRYEGPEGHQRYPDSLTTSFEFRKRFNNDVITDTTAFETEYINSFAIDGLQADLVVFDGFTSTLLNSTTPQDTLLLDYDAGLDAVTFERVELETSDDPHPQSGGLTLSMFIHAVNAQGSTSISWNVQITFFPDHLHARFESGDNYWEWDEAYGG
jgi:hypothetical protein